MNNQTPAQAKPTNLVGSAIGVVASLGLLLTMQTSAAAQVAISLLAAPQATMTETQPSAGGVMFDHSNFDKLLKAHVDKDGWVDYEGFWKDKAQLKAYLKSLSEANVDQLGRDERLALLINSYNAFTISLILENYPVKSIKDIPDAQRWEAVRWNIGGNIVSLNQIENTYVRPVFKEPRIHFSLVCGAIGCPPLRNEAFAGKTLEKQLASQSKYVHDHATWFQFDRNTNRVGLTKLYEWYGTDFQQAAGSIFNFIRNNSDKLANVNTPTITWLDYDWNLNDIKKRAPR